MKLIKLAFISLLVFFILATLISLFIPSHLRISKAVNIAADKDSIYSYVSNTRQWPDWYPVLSESGTGPEFVGNDSIQIKGTGIRIIDRQAGQILATMRSESGRGLETGWKFMHIAQQDSVTVQWFMDFNLSWYPWDKFSSLFYESLYGVQMEKGLARLKELSEKQNP